MKFIVLLSLLFVAIICSTTEKEQQYNLGGWIRQSNRQWVNSDIVQIALKLCPAPPGFKKSLSKIEIQVVAGRKYRFLIKTENLKLQERGQLNIQLYEDLQEHIELQQCQQSLVAF
ncbi:hypothetical protein IMG5_008870 [Ichthyophthirius multifiliis]|uniref:Cystatin domain-containing protein n=1 Tax=Ichthyophthirius multifiliis TaxID=5932 RepID=G0QJT6_ICHMU|nr:hypothetical protein IMG5_008870 [Ichthyophthirius multifiliis]EGR34520.1 hypothetical protein IMG5_008870 [Ichthyophthirius multifiliis]|eukprot:XP_004039824.1 hypothetical protein IMG5_008870 [Ichthyophthirius multifiliis]